MNGDRQWEGSLAGANMTEEKMVARGSGKEKARPEASSLCMLRPIGVG